MRAEAASDPAAYRPIAFWIAGVGLGIRILGWSSVWQGPIWLLLGQPLSWLHGGLGMLLQIAALLLAYRRQVDWAIFASGLDFLALSSLTPRFGFAAELHLYALLLPFMVLALSRWSLSWRIFLSVLPLWGFAVLRFWAEPPVTGELLSPDQLRNLSTFNALVFISLSLAVTIFTLRLREAAAAQARSLAEERSRLLDDMSHELRTPAAVLLTSAQAALSRERSGDFYRETLAVVERQSRSLGRMIARMLELSRAERGEMTVLENDDLAASIREIARGFEQLAGERSVALSLDLAALEAKTDSTVLAIVLGNLLVNAIRYSPPQGRIDIELREDGRGRRLTVRDQGPGIAPEDLPHVFERYWRADPARSRRDGHLGLGLAIAQHYARWLGASLKARSPPGAGAELEISWSPRPQPFAAARSPKGGPEGAPPAKA